MKKKSTSKKMTSWKMKSFIILFLSVLGITNAQAQYCAAGASSGFDTQIMGVSLTGGTSNINYTHTCPGNTGLLDLTASQTSDLIVNQTYSVDVTWGSCGGYYGGVGELWIDWDQDQVFQATESIGTYTASGSHIAGNYVFTVPTGAIPGNTRMRVMINESGSLPLSSCATFTYGSAIDFGITVTSATACSGSPTPGTATGPVSICPSQNFQLVLTGQSLDNGINLQWLSSSSSTGPWVNIPGATSSNLTTNQTSSMYYRCEVTCTNSNLSDTSTAAYVAILPNLAAGTYTIGATGNYPDFASALNAMNCGIAGPVIFNVASGIYNEQIEIGEIIGTSATNTVTFKGADPANTKLIFAQN
ncbi:MAG: GEVED domain-containing protein, partial [Bacteroidota bacterium]|nr:GEVED domain-containing protein [Bacteroidota bacterium]